MAGPLACRCCLAVGGLPRREQAAELKRGVAIVVATPGRLQDLVADNICRHASLAYGWTASCMLFIICMCPACMQLHPMQMMPTKLTERQS